MIENVLTMSRGAREVTRSVHMVVAVKGNTGMKQYLGIRVSWGRAVSFVSRFEIFVVGHIS